MSPRKYDMSRRAAAAQQTRERIARATFACHSRLGVAATSWEDIAKEAGVAVGTVYRHFPSLDELLPACGVHFWAAIDLEGLVERSAALARADDPLRALVELLLAYWEACGEEIEGMRVERVLHPVLEEGQQRIERALDATVRGALGADAPEAEVAVARALADVTTWRMLRERGIDGEEAVDRVTAALRCALA